MAEHRIWPALPIVIRSRVTSPRKRGMTHIIAALTGHNVVRGIHIDAIPTSLLEQFAAFKNTLLALTSLTLSSRERNPPALIDSFLGGSAPRLQNLDLRNIPYPGLGKLLLSTSHLARLSLWDISYSRYMSPGVMATSLSKSTRLKKLVLVFLKHSFTRNPPSPTTVVLPALADFKFSGNSEYLEDFLSQIDAPLLKNISIYIVFSIPPPSGTPLLRLFLSRTEAFKTSHQVDILFYKASAKVTLFRQKRESDHKLQEFQLSYELMNWPLSWSLPRLCGSFLPPLLTVERLYISDFGEHPKEDPTAPWLELLAPFISVRDLNISCSLSVVAPALGELTGERTIEVLPALQNIFVGHLPSEEHVREALARFTAVRQLSGHPVTIRYEGR
jgi:hypothetical protein